MRINVTGVTFSNEDGSSRAMIIASMSEHDQVCLEREPYNQFDANAVKVLVIKNGEKKQIGYLPKEIAGEVSSKLRRNVNFFVYIVGVGMWNNRPYCELDITEAIPTASFGSMSSKAATTPTAAGPTFNPSRPTTTPAAGPTFNPSRPTTTLAADPISNHSKITTTPAAAPYNNPSSPSVSTKQSEAKMASQNTQNSSSLEPAMDQQSNNSGCLSLIIGLVVAISLFL